MTFLTIYNSFPTRPLRWYSSQDYISLLCTFFGLTPAAQKAEQSENCEIHNDNARADRRLKGIGRDHAKKKAAKAKTGRAKRHRFETAAHTHGG